MASRRKNGANGQRQRHAVAQRAADRREAAQLLRTLIDPAPPRRGARAERSDNLKNSLAAIAAALNWSQTRAEDIWHGEARRIDAWEMDALREKIRRNFRS